MATDATLPPRRGAVGLWCRAGSLALLLFGRSAGAVEVEIHGNLVAIRAESEPLRAVLEAVAESCNVEIHSNTLTSDLVTVDARPQPLPHLLRSLLRDHSYVLQYSDDGASRRWLWILAPAGNGDADAAWSATPRDQSLDALVLDLADPDPEVRVEAVLSLGDIGGIGGMEVEPFLTQSLADASDEVREAARAVLDDIGPQNSHSTPTAGTIGSQ
jgi:hypothetical protein